MLFPTTDWQSFHDSQGFASWVTTSNMTSPVKCPNNLSFNIFPFPLSAEGFLQTPIKSAYNHSNQPTPVTTATPKKLFRPWTDDEEEECKPKEADGKVQGDAKSIKCCLENHQTKHFPHTLPIVSSGVNTHEPFSTKVRQLTESLSSSRDVDDEYSKTTLELIATNLGKSADGHRCIYCGKMYSRKYGLKIHLRTHTGFKPLKCKICQRPFGDPSNLNKHTRLHAESGVPMFQCHLCGKTLVRKRDLERHLASRHPEDEEVLDVEHL